MDCAAYDHRRDCRVGHYHRRLERASELERKEHLGLDENPRCGYRLGMPRIYLVHLALEFDQLQSEILVDANFFGTCAATIIDTRGFIH